MARIKNPLTLIKGGGGYGEYNIDQVINGEDCELIISQAEGVVEAKNINFYKYQDIARINQEGGILATKQEYETAEIRMQEIYKNVIKGGNI